MNYPFLVFKKHEKKLYSNLRNQSLRIQLRIHGKNQRREGWGSKSQVSREYEGGNTRWMDVAQ